MWPTSHKAAALSRSSNVQFALQHSIVAKAPSQPRFILTLTCVFGSFPIHRCRWGSPLPAILRLSRVALVRWLPWPRIRTPWWHLTSRVVGVAGVGLGHVNWLGVALRWVALWWVALSRVARSRGVVWWRLVRVHLWLKQSPEKQWGCICYCLNVRFH